MQEQQCASKTSAVSPAPSLLQAVHVECTDCAHIVRTQPGAGFHQVLPGQLQEVGGAIHAFVEAALRPIPAGSSIVVV